jgi:hypothetical protein
MEHATFSSVFDTRTWRSIDQPDAAKLLTDLSELRYLEPFFGHERTVKEAADVLKVTIDDLYFRVRRAQKLGLLRVVNLEPRAGRAMKRYTLVADGFYVPFRVVPNIDFEALVLGFELQLERLLIRNVLAAGHDDSFVSSFGVRVYLDDAGHLTADAAKGPTQPYDFLASENPGIYTTWNQLELDFEDAKDLQRDLHAVWQKYARKKGAQSYLLRLGLAPLLQTKL